MVHGNSKFKVISLIIVSKIMPPFFSFFKKDLKIANNMCQMANFPEQTVVDESENISVVGLKIEW